jgi:digeranylgeranylglycerophospholipid reductase
MQEYDIVVAGAGPSGLQFAREVGQQTKYSVAVLESNNNLTDNDKSTGGTFDQVVEGFDIPGEVIMDSNPGVIFEGSEASEWLRIPNYVLDFPNFLDYLGEDAEKHSVDIFTGARVDEPLIEDGEVVGVRCPNGPIDNVIKADIVVDATGPAGVLTTKLGMWDPAEAQRGIGKEYEVEGNFDSDSMLFKFDHEYAPGGYAWVFPAGDGAFKAGVCWVDDFYEIHKPIENRNIDRYVRNWLDGDSRWNGDRIRAAHAGVAISDNSINCRARDNVLAVGDSVSSINPLFGEGIRPGMESARMAADVAIEALNAGDTSRNFLAKYEQRWNSEKGAKWKTQRMVGELLYDFNEAQQNAFVRKAGDMTDEQLKRLQKYELTIPDLLELYPFHPRDISKAPTLLRHIV